MRRSGMAGASAREVILLPSMDRQFGAGGTARLSILPGIDQRQTGNRREVVGVRRRQSHLIRQCDGGDPGILGGDRAPGLASLDDQLRKTLGDLAVEWHPPLHAMQAMYASKRLPEHNAPPCSRRDPQPATCLKNRYAAPTAAAKPAASATSPPATAWRTRLMPTEPK